MALTEQERNVRRRASENATATLRIEGLEASPEAEAIFKRYVEGELTLEQMGSAIDRLHERQCGPVRLPRNEHATV